MATADEYAAWIVQNQSKRGTPEFQTVAQAYELAKQEESQAVPTAPQGGSFARGFASYGPQLRETVGGVQTLLGAGVEKLGATETGKGMIQSGIERIKKAEKEQEALARPEESDITKAYEKGLGTVFGDYLPYQMGSGAAQLLESLGLSVAGGLAGSAMAPGPGTVGGVLAGAVGKQALKLGVKEAVEKIALEKGKDAAREFEQQALAKITKDIAKEYGKNTAIGLSAAGYGFGQTTSRAVTEAIERGEDPAQIDLGRVLPAGAVSTAAEFLSDKLGLGALKGLKKETQKELTDTAQTMLSRSMRIAGQAAKGALVTGSKEAPTELVQQMAERYGAKLSLDDQQAMNEYVNAIAGAYAMSIAPGAIGGVRVRKEPKPYEQPKAEGEAAKVATPEVQAAPQLTTGAELATVAPEVAPTRPTIPELRRMADREAEQQRRAEEAGFGFEREQAKAQAETARKMVEPEKQERPDYVDLRPLETPLAQKQALAVARDEAKQEGIDPVLITLEPHPSIPEAMTLVRQPLPEVAPTPEIPAAEVEQRLSQAEANAAEAQRVEQRRKEDEPRQIVVTRALKNIEERNGVASPEEARILQEANLGTPYDRIDESIVPAKSIDQQLSEATGIAVGEAAGLGRRPRESVAFPETKPFEYTPEEQGQKRPEEVPPAPVSEQKQMVQAWVDSFTAPNTDAARAFKQAYEAGQIPDADIVRAIESKMPVDEISQRLEKAAAAAPKERLTPAGIKYSLREAIGAPKEEKTGNKASDLAAEVRKQFGAAGSKLLEAGRIKIVDTVADLPGGPHPDNVRGMYLDGNSYIVAENVPVEDVRGLVLHEVGTHAGMKEMLGDTLYEQVLGEVEQRAKTDPVFAKAQEMAKERAADPSQVREETLAYLVETAPQLPLVKRVLAAIRQWLYRLTGGRVIKLNNADLQMMAVAAVRDYAKRGEGREGKYYGAEGAATINVDGVDRPMMNSEGRPIHPTEEGIRNFWKWFGDSKVVDEQGRPLIVYHGTGADFTSFEKGKTRFQRFDFATNANIASDYARRSGYGGNVIPVYLSLQNPASYEKYLEARKEFGTRNSPTALQNEGNDGVLGQGFAFAFSPEQIKSAIGNIGTFSPKKEDIRYSTGPTESLTRKALEKAEALRPERRLPLDEATLEGLKPEDKKALQEQFFPKQATIAEKFDSLKENMWERVIQGVFDQYRTIKKYSDIAYIQARMSKVIDGVLEGLLFKGHAADRDGGLTIKQNTKGLLEALQPLGKEVDRFLMWMALNRDARLPEEKRSLNHLAHLRTELNAGEINGKSRAALYESVRKDMNAINKSVLDIAKMKGIIDDAAYERFSNDIFYIPFYREMENGDVQSPSASTGLTNQYFSKQLKGSEKPFGDLLENLMRNWSHILSASQKNQAAVSTMKAAEQQFVAEKIDAESFPDFGQREQALKGAVKVMENGKPAYYKVSDPMLVEAISALDYTGPKQRPLLVAQRFKKLLTIGITAAPGYKVRTLIRESIASMAIAGLDRNPVVNATAGISNIRNKSDIYIEGLAGGAIFNLNTAYEGDQATLVKRLIDKGVDENTILNTPERIKNGLMKAYRKYEEWGNMAENANRMALYEKLRGEGMNHLEASYHARDLQDFGLHGSWPAMRALCAVIPFLGARLQGLYKIGRDGISPTARMIYNDFNDLPVDEDTRIKGERFSTMTMYVAMASAALYLMYRDDEDFKKREDWDRDTFWWIKIPGMDYAFRIPKPFEIGAIGTIVERSLEQIVDKGAEGKKFKESMQRIVHDTFAITIVPQMFAPLLDVEANKNGFTQAPIESAGMERLSKQERITESTTPLAKALGGLSKAIGAVTFESVEKSPVQMDYLIEGYFGWLGATVAMTTHYAMMPFEEGTKPNIKYADVFSAGFVKELPANQSQWVTSFYNNNKDIQQAYADMRHYAALGDMQKAAEIFAEKKDKIGLSKYYDKVSKDMAEIRKQIAIVTNDNKMSGEEKRDRIDRFKQLISTMAQQAEEVRLKTKQ